MGLGKLAFVTCVGSLASALLVIDTERFNGSKVDANADAGADYAALVPGNKSGGGDDQVLAPFFTRGIVGIRTLVRRCWPRTRKKGRKGSEGSGLFPNHAKLSPAEIKEAVQLRVAAYSKDLPAVYDKAETLTLCATEGKPSMECGDQTMTPEGKAFPFGCVDSPGYWKGKVSGPKIFEQAVSKANVCDNKHWTSDIPDRVRPFRDCVSNFCAVVKQMGSSSAAGKVRNSFKYALACCKKILPDLDN